MNLYNLSDKIVFKILKDINLIISTDQDEIDNS